MWGSGGSDERGRLLEDFVESRGATVINTGQPTYQHYMYNGLQSHLDVAIVSSDLDIQANGDVLNNTMGSDHSPTVVTLDEVGEIGDASGDRSFPKLSRTNWREFKRLCNETITTNTVGLDNDVDAMYKNIVKIITETAKKCTPRRCGKSFSDKKKRKRLPYWNDSCRNAIYNRNRARNKMNRNRTPDNVQEYRRLKGIAQKTIKNSTATYWGDYCTRNTLNRTIKLSTIWRTIKN